MVNKNNLLSSIFVKNVHLKKIKFLKSSHCHGFRFLVRISTTDEDRGCAGQQSFFLLLLGIILRFENVTCRILFLKVI